METVRLEGVKRYRSRGREYFYHRGTGERLPDDPQERALRVLEINTRPKVAPRKTVRREESRPGSLAGLVVRYKRRPEFKKLAPSTRRGYSVYLDDFRRDDIPVDAIERRHVYDLRDRCAATPRAANLRVALLSVLMGWAVDRGWRTDNPARGIKKLQGGKSYEPWPDAAIQRFRAKARPHLVRAMELGLFTGQRLGDVLAMEWRHIRDGLVSVQQRKTGEQLATPLHPELAAVLDQIPRVGMAIVHKADGRPYTRDGFTSVLRKELARLGRTGLVFHGLRHSAGKHLAEAGCTDRELMAILGHRSATMVTRYTRGADQERLAKSAVVKLKREQVIVKHR